jgi:hypothetical protein
MRSSNILLVLSFAFVTVTTVGCGTDVLPKYYLLDRLRVLGANTVGAAAEFSGGDAGIQVAFHISDPKGAGRTLSYSLESCVDPGIGIGATPSCANNPTRTVITALSTFVPGTAATNFYGVLTTPAFSVPAAGIMFIDPTTGSPKPTYQQDNGVAYIVILRLTATTTENLIAYKRVIVSTKAAKNQNPTFGSPALTLNGLDATTYTLTTDAIPMNSSVATGSVETYFLEDSNGTSATKTEALTVTWFTNAGQIRYTRTDPGVENRYTPPAPLATVTSIIAVLRDDRGGEAITVIQKP